MPRSRPFERARILAQALDGSSGQRWMLWSLDSHLGLTGGRCRHPTSQLMPRRPSTCPERAEPWWGQGSSWLPLFVPSVCPSSPEAWFDRSIFFWLCSNLHSVLRAPHTHLPLVRSRSGEVIIMLEVSLELLDGRYIVGVSVLQATRDTWFQEWPSTACTLASR